MPQLVCHPGTPCDALERFTATVSWLPDGRLALQYVMQGDIDDIRFPAFTTPGHADGLWRHTCCEAFIAENGDAYREFNFSPSAQWAAYRFHGYREGMQPLAGKAAIAVDRTTRHWKLDAILGADLLPQKSAGFRIGLAAVVEKISGTLSYWALLHPRERPDFHDARGFGLTLPHPP